MQFFPHLSLSRKLLIGLLATCMPALVFATAALLWVQATVARATFVAEIESLGAIIAHTSAGPLALSDPKAASTVLNALKAKPQIVSARVFDGSGKLFSQFTSGPALTDLPPVQAASGVSLVDGLAQLTLPIGLAGTLPGRLELRARYDGAYGRFGSLDTVVLLVVFIGAGIVILLLSGPLQRQLTLPIAALAEVARGVSERSDYSVRVPEAGRDEVGLLTRTFNQMLDHIQTREAHLHESKQRYEVAVMGSSDGLWDCNLATNAVYYSPRWKKMLGFQDHELPNRMESFTSRIHPDEAAAIQDGIAAYLANPATVYERTFRLRHKDGFYRWILSRGAALRDAQGRAIRFAGSHTEITERKLAEEHERQRIDRFARRQAILLKLSQSTTLDWHHQVRILLPEVARFLGVERVSLWQSQSLSLALKREEQFVLSQAGFESGAPKLRESDLPPYFSHFAQNGSPVAIDDVQNSPALAEFSASHHIPYGIKSVIHAPVCQNGRLSGVIFCEHVGSARSWTEEEIDFLRLVTQQATLGLESHERRRAETHLRQSEARYRSVVESVKEVVFQADTDGAWIFLNSAWRDITGFILEDSLGRPCVDFVHPDDRSAFSQLMQPVFEQHERGCQGKFRFLTRDGELRWIELMAQVTIDGDHVLGGLSGTLTDITAKVASEAEMTRLNRELVETSRQAGMAEIATGVLHNVGNVLNSVNVSANLIFEQVTASKTSSLAKAVQLLREHKADIGAFLTSDPKGRQLPLFIEAISDQLTREQLVLSREVQDLQANIEHIKQIVVMQQGYAKFSGALENLALADLVEDALRLSSGALARHRVEVVREFTAVPAVLADRHKVLQILVNLISNAEQALDSRVDDRRLSLRLTAAADHRVLMEVSDNGIGIPPENLNRIFNHGFTTKKTGHGFGLHSCANAAKELGGSLSVHSEGPGMGATFSLFLPTLAAKAAGATRAPFLHATQAA
ncbi:MAG: PAS domain-containing protein [Opitutaceae bacterium]